jgi:hypothetical protein
MSRPGAQRRTRSKTGRFLRQVTGLLPLALLGSGCLVVPIPTNRWDPSSRTNIAAGTGQRWAPGRDTREQVLLRLGEPDEAVEDERRLSYHADRVQWDIFWVAGGGYSAAGGDIEIHKHRELMLWFDEQGCLQKVRSGAGYDPNQLRARLVAATTNDAPVSVQDRLEVSPPPP